MKRLFYLVLLVFIGGTLSVNAQVTVGANTNPEATLDVVGQATKATVADGVIAPRLSLAQLQAKDLVYTAAQDGVIVYVNDVTTGTPTPAGKTVNVKAPGYYYYDGTATTPEWKSLGGGGAPAFQKEELTATHASTTLLIDPKTTYVLNRSTTDARLALPTTGVEIGAVVTVTSLAGSNIQLWKQDGSAGIASLINGSLGAYLLDKNGDNSIVASGQTKSYVFLGGASGYEVWVVQAPW